jgi:hypothetical protein
MPSEHGEAALINVVDAVLAPAADKTNRENGSGAKLMKWRLSSQRVRRVRRPLKAPGAVR